MQILLTLKHSSCSKIKTHSAADSAVSQADRVTVQEQLLTLRQSHLTQLQEIANVTNVDGLQAGTQCMIVLIWEPTRCHLVEQSL